MICHIFIGVAAALESVGQLHFKGLFVVIGEAGAAVIGGMNDRDCQIDLVLYLKPLGIERAFLRN